MQICSVLWFAYKLVSLQKISTTLVGTWNAEHTLWFAYKLVSLQKISTTDKETGLILDMLWFAYKLVSLQKISTTPANCIMGQLSCDLLTN